MSASISLRRTGLVVFTARVASVLTGLVFLVMITRSLSDQQFGFYEVITDVVAFAAYPAGLVSFWATRDIARGKMFGRTALALNVALSALGILFYLALSYFSAAKIESAGFGTLAFAAILVPVAYFNQAANAVVQGHRPIVLGYAVIFSEAAKLLVAFPLLVVYKVGIDGVILAVMAANLAQALASAILAGDAISLPLSGDQARRWLGMSWLPLLTSLPLVLALADTYIASLAEANTVLVGHYQAAFSVASLAGYALYLAAAMYPLLLKGGSDEVTSMTLDLALAFGIPMAVGAAVLATPVLQLLNPLYLDASLALGILAISSLVNTVSVVLDWTLLGKDRVDVDESATFRDLVKSNIFFVAKVDLTISVVYLASVFLTLTYARSAGLSMGSTLDVWALAQLAIFTSFIFVKVSRIRKTGRLIVPRSVGYYVIGAGIMAAILYLLEPLIDVNVGTFTLAGELVLVGGAGISIYGAFVLALDRDLRAIIRRAISQQLA